MIFDYIRLRRLGLKHKPAADATNLDELIRTVKAGVSIIAALLALLAAHGWAVERDLAETAQHQTR